MKLSSDGDAEFVEAVQESFSFLVSDFEYSSHVEDTGVVMYANDSLGIRILRERGSFMIYVEVFRTDTRETFTLHEVLDALAPYEVRHAQCSGRDKNSTRRCLDQLARICRLHLRDVLTMDDAAFEKIAISANQIRGRLTLQAQYGTIRDRANSAWNHKDWKAARKFYEEARPALSATEQRRLDFLLKSGV